MKINFSWIDFLSKIEFFSVNWKFRDKILFQIIIFIEFLPSVMVDMASSSRPETKVARDSE